MGGGGGAAGHLKSNRYVAVLVGEKVRRQSLITLREVVGQPGLITLVCKYIYCLLKFFSQVIQSTTPAKSGGGRAG